MAKRDKKNDLESLPTREPKSEILEQVSDATAKEEPGKLEEVEASKPEGNSEAKSHDTEAVAEEKSEVKNRSELPRKYHKFL